MSWSSVATSYFSCMFGFLKLFRCNYAILHLHQQCESSLVSPHPCQHLVVSLFQFYLFWSCMYACVLVYWCLIIVLICISLIANEHLFIYLFAICISSLVKYLLTIFKSCFWFLSTGIYSLVLENWIEYWLHNTWVWIEFSTPRAQISSSVKTALW